MAEETPTVQDDWIASTTDSIIGYVDKARTMGTDNAVRALRGIVFGLVAMVFGIASLIFTLIMLVRFADAYLPIGNGVGDATWSAHLLIGTLLAVIGLGLWAMRKREGNGPLMIAGAIDFVILVAIVAYGFAS